MTEAHYSKRLKLWMDTVQLADLVYRSSLNEANLNNNKLKDLREIALDVSGLVAIGAARHCDHQIIPHLRNGLEALDIMDNQLELCKLQGLLNPTPIEMLTRKKKIVRRRIIGLIQEAEKGLRV